MLRIFLTARVAPKFKETFEETARGRHGPVARREGIVYRADKDLNDKTEAGRMLKFLAQRLSSMRRIFMVMIAFGLTVGLVFPLIAGPFVTWNPDHKIYFRLASLVAGFLVGTFCYFLVKITLYQRNMELAHRKVELEDAKEKFSTLTHKVIRTQDWNVIFEDPHVPNCWEVKNCSSTACPVYGREHVRCWLIAGDFCNGKVQGRFAKNWPTVQNVLSTDRQ